MSILGVVHKRLMEGTYLGIELVEQPLLPAISFLSFPASVDTTEGENTPILVQIQRTGILDEVCSVDWALSGTIVNSQYITGQALSGTIVFDVSEVQKTLQITLGPQNKSSLVPTIIVTLGSVVGAEISGPSTATILVHLPAPDLSEFTPHASISAFTDTILAETNKNKFGTVTVTRTGSDLEQNSSVNFTVSGMPSDKFVAAQIYSGTLSWAPGDVSMQVSVGVNWRTEGEANQVVTVVFSGATNLVWEGALTATINIDMPDEDDTGTGTIHTFDKTIGWKDQNGVQLAYEPGSLRKRNTGVFAITGSNLDYVNTQMGFKCPLQGSKIFQVEKDWLADTWPKTHGSQSLSTPVGTIISKSQGALRQRNGVVDIINRNARVSSGAWMWLGATPVPMFSNYSIIQDVIDGDHDNNLKRIGQNWRYEVDAKSFDYRRVICRLGYEFNQNTALRFSGTGGVGSIFDVPGMTLSKFKQFFARCITKIWEGYGYRMPIALSPAFESTYNSMTNKIGTDTMSGTQVSHRRYWIEYSDLMFDEIAICCGSFHPVDYRVVTKAMAIANCTEGSTVAEELELKRYSPAVIMRVARATGRQVAYLEHNVSQEDPKYYDQSLKYACWAYKAFGELLTANEDIVFGTAALGTFMFNPAASPGGHKDNTVAWRNLVAAHLYHFGKVGKYSDPSGNFPN